MGSSKIVFVLFAFLMTIFSNGKAIDTKENYSTSTYRNGGFGVSQVLDEIFIECDNKTAALAVQLINNSHPYLKSHYKTLKIKHCALNSSENIYLNAISNLQITVDTVYFMNLKSTLTRKQLQGLEIKNLVLLKSPFYATKDFLYDLPLVSFKVFGSNNFTEIPDEFFEKSTTLEVFQISGTQLEKIKTNDFSNLKQLSTLNMISNPALEKIEPKAFDDLTSLRRLQLSDSQKLAHLSPEIFKNLQKLEYLILKNNSLTALPEDLLFGLRSITELDLSSNNITDLPAEFFMSTTSLKVLFISDNKIKTIPDGLFQNLDLDWLDLSYNQLTKLSSAVETPSLKELVVTNNKLREIEGGFCKIAQMLKGVDLSHNNLILNQPTSDYWSRDFIHCHQLTRLNLSHNNLTSYPYWMYSSDPDVNKNVYLNYNNIKVLNVAILCFYLEHFHLHLSGDSLTTIDLSMYDNYKKDCSVTYKSETEVVGGPYISLTDLRLDCDCRLITFVKFLNYDPGSKILRKNTKFNLDSVTCRSPPELKGRDVSRDILAEDLFCTEPNCAANCTCSDYPESNILLMNCSNRNFERIDHSFWESYDNKKNRIIKLDLSGNKLTITPNLKHSFLKNVTHLDLTSNKITKITLDVLPDHLRELKLHNNSFTILEDHMVDKLKNHKLVRLTLHNNSWTCSCEASSFVEFVIKSSKNIDNHTEIRCSDSNNRVAHLTRLLPCHLILPSIAFVAISTLAIVLGVLAALYYKHKKVIRIWMYSKGWFLSFVSEDDLDEDKEYDAFISYSHEDEAFVYREIVEKLESRPKPYKLCLHGRDWLADTQSNTTLSGRIEEDNYCFV